MMNEFMNNGCSSHWECTDYASLEGYEIDLSAARVTILISEPERFINDEFYAEQHLISPKSLTWRRRAEGSVVLTLQEIAEQVQIEGTIIVMTEMAKSGESFIFNKYGDRRWHEHGTTHGYA